MRPKIWESTEGRGGSPPDSPWFAQLLKIGTHPTYTLTDHNLPVIVYAEAIDARIQSEGDLEKRYLLPPF